MKNDRRHLPADDFDDGDKKISSGDDFTKEKKWLIIKLLILIIPEILYWVTRDNNFEKKVSVNVAVDAGVSSKKTDAQVEPPKVAEEKIICRPSFSPQTTITFCLPIKNLTKEPPLPPETITPPQ